MCVQRYNALRKVYICSAPLRLLLNRERLVVAREISMYECPTITGAMGHFELQRCDANRAWPWRRIPPYLGSKRMHYALNFLFRGGCIMHADPLVELPSIANGWRCIRAVRMVLVPWHLLCVADAVQL